ncbi:di-trans,poly-cis-decaprenylcistransferase [Candidatus Woesearchaeota archaeon]|nr:di-trans,poly-cis-decaprenylcistransferase [Candidatus Woesearchaeota archaeon]
MFGLKKNINILHKNKKIEKNYGLPKHIAISINGINTWAEKNKKEPSIAYKESFLAIKKLIGLQTKLDIPVLTFNLLHSKIKKKEGFPEIVEYLIEFFSDLREWEFIVENQIKISVLGKWYDLAGGLVEEIKDLTMETKDYDKFFVNFCVNYDGQEEIVDSFRIIARKVRGDLLDPDAITKEEVKDNLYSSYFVPPDTILLTGGKKNLDGFLLWDSVNARIVFSDKLWPEFKDADFIEIINLL